MSIYNFLSYDKRWLFFNDGNLIKFTLMYIKDENEFDSYLYYIAN